jgi:hypothetical protein
MTSVVDVVVLKQGVSTSFFASILLIVIPPLTHAIALSRQHLITYSVIKLGLPNMMV